MNRMTQRKETYLHKSGEGHNIEHRFAALGQKYEKPTAEAPRLDSTADSEEREKLNFFYHTDHLNSTNFVTDIDGNAVQFISYIPYGEVFVEERNSSFSSSYLFNAKELDNETGLYYYGARYLDPQTALWLSVDPLFEKYPGVSSYSYCVGNPVRLVDLDGREIFICDGNESFKYDSKSVYKGNSEFISKNVCVLDEMNSTKSGSTVLNSLVKSNTIYKLKNESNSYAKGYAVTKGTETDLGGALELNVLAHEMFHHFQRENGQGGSTFFNEIEAFSFEKFVVMEYNDNLSDEDILNGMWRQWTHFDSSLDALNPVNSKEYEYSAKNIIVNGVFNAFNFDRAVDLFEYNSNVNSSGLYSKPHYKKRSGYEKAYLLEKIYSR